MVVGGRLCRDRHGAQVAKAPSEPCALYERMIQLRDRLSLIRGDAEDDRGFDRNDFGRGRPPEEQAEVNAEGKQEAGNAKAEEVVWEGPTGKRTNGVPRAQRVDTVARQDYCDGCASK